MRVAGVAATLSVRILVNLFFAWLGVPPIRETCSATLAIHKRRAVVVVSALYVC